MVVWHCPCKSSSPPGALYLKTLTGNGGGFFFVAVRVADTRCNRSPPGALFKNPSRYRGGVFFLCCCASRNLAKPSRPLLSSSRRRPGSSDFGLRFSRQSKRSLALAI